MATIRDGSLLFIYDCQSDDATLSGGDWLDALPLSNVQSQRLEKIARSSDADPDSTLIKVALKKPLDFACAYVGWTNLTDLAKARIRIWSSSAFAGTPTFDSGWLEDVVAADDDPDRGPSLFLLLDQSQTAQFISIEIDDNLNFNGSIDVGRLIIGRYVKPSFNYTYDDNSLSFVSKAIVSSTLSGDEMVWDRIEPRTFSMSFQYLPEDEVFTDFYRMLRTIKRGGEVVVIPQPNANALALQRRSFLGQAVNRDGIIQQVVNRGGVSLEIREKMGLAPVPDTGGAIVLLPVDGMKIRDFVPAVTTSIIIEPPVDALDITDFAPDICTGAVIALPLDAMVITDYPVGAGSGVIIDLPLDGMDIGDFAPVISSGAALFVPLDALEVQDYAPSLITGTTINLPLDAMVWRDYPLSIGNAAIVEIPTDQLDIQNYAPDIRAGVVISLPVDGIDIEDYAARIAIGTIVLLPVDDGLESSDYPTRVPEFDAGFDAGFA
jgi:hypothetical protein